MAVTCVGDLYVLERFSAKTLVTIGMRCNNKAVE